MRHLHVVFATPAPEDVPRQEAQAVDTRDQLILKPMPYLHAVVADPAAEDVPGQEDQSVEEVRDQLMLRPFHLPAPGILVPIQGVVLQN